VDHSRIVQTNYCFFRSLNEGQITARDLNLCYPIFDELLKLLKPSQIISFSSRLKQVLLEKGRLISENKLLLLTNKGEYHVLKAYLSVDSKPIPIAFLPHPNYPIGGDQRIKAWDFAFS
jgi:uracil-DNA glycosylase